MLLWPPNPQLSVAVITIDIFFHVILQGPLPGICEPIYWSISGGLYHQFHMNRSVTGHLTFLLHTFFNVTGILSFIFILAKLTKKICSAFVNAVARMFQKIIVASRNALLSISYVREYSSVHFWAFHLTNINVIDRVFVILLL